MFCSPCWTLSRLELPGQQTALTWRTFQRYGSCSYSGSLGKAVGSNETGNDPALKVEVVVVTTDHNVDHIFSVFADFLSAEIRRVHICRRVRVRSFWTFRYPLGLKSDAAMFSQSSVNIPEVLILILLAVLQVKVDCKPAEQRVVKKICGSPCRSRGNCYYNWYRDGQHVGCSFSDMVWFVSTRSSNQDRYSCVVYNYRFYQQHCELGDQQWAVTYTPERVCALKGSSINFSCTYKHPEGLTMTKSLWFIESHWSLGDKDVRESDQYKGRVQYSRTLNSCRMTITDLRGSDAHTYRFRFYTDDPDGRYSGSPGVTLSVTDLKVTVSDTDGGVKKLTCSSTCTLPNNPTYIWYKNGQPVSDQNRNELKLRDRTVDAGSYSCAVKGYEELCSPDVCVFDKVLQVKVEGPAATALEGLTVMLTCSSTCTLPNNPTYIWYKNGQPVSECESASCPVAVVSEAVRYCCAVKGSDFHSPLVYSPKTTRAVILPSGQRVEGDSVTLICSSDANPPVLSYSWFNQSSDVELGTGQSYSITSISSQHSGLYYCTARNQLGQSRSGPSRLDVLYSPRPPSVSETEVNGSVTLVCVSDSNPASSYTWFRKTGGNITQFGEGASLTLAAGADGVFYCTAENPYGSSNSSEWTLTSAGLWKQFAVWGTIGLISALVLSFIIAVLCVRRKSGAERRIDVQASKSGDDTYSALSPNTMSSNYDTLTPVRDYPSDTYSALNPETRTSDYGALTVVRPHPAMRRAPENEN
ncbi:hypothetical protein SRHO_G00104240 [Serrasalmus rhombeus]